MSDGATDLGYMTGIDRSMETHQRQHELHDVRHHGEHSSHTRDHVHLAESTAAALTALRDEMRGTRETHRRMHEQEAEALTLALSSGDRLRDFHDAAHSREHDAHKAVHDKEQAGVSTALASVDRERVIHAAAHDREHTGHLVIHDLGQLAIGKAEASVEERLRAMNDLRGQLRDQQTAFATRDALEAFQREMERRFAESAVTTSQHFVAAEKLTQDRFEANRSSIAALKETDLKGEGRMIGQGATIAAIVGSVVFASTLLGIIVVLANVLTT